MDKARVIIAGALQRPVDREHSAPLFAKADEIIAALDAAGWVIVPKVPTPEMIAAGAAADWVGDLEGSAGQSILLLQFSHDLECEGDEDPSPPPLELSSPGIWAAMVAAVGT